MLGDRVALEPVLLQIPLDAHRAVAAARARGDQCLGETSRRHDPVGVEPRHHAFGNRGRRALRAQLRNELPWRVLAPGQEAQGRRARGGLVVLVQASASSTAAALIAIGT